MLAGSGGIGGRPDGGGGGRDEAVAVLCMSDGALLPGMAPLKLGGAEVRPTTERVAPWLAFSGGGLLRAPTTVAAAAVGFPGLFRAPTRAAARDLRLVRLGDDSPLGLPAL